MNRRVFLITAGYFPDSTGGAARQAFILSHALAKLGVDVTIVAPSTDPSAPAVEETAFGRVERFHDSAYPNEGGRKLPAFVRWTRWFCRTYRGRITRDTPVYAFHARLHALGPALAAVEAGAPLAIKLGGGGEASDFAALRAKRFFYGAWVQRYLLRHVDRFVANGAQIERDLAALGVAPDRIAAFPNGVVVPPHEELVAAMARRSGRRFIFAGRLVADKRLHVLYEAAVAMAHDAVRPELVLLGDGPERERLVAVARSGDPEQVVSFPGYRADVYPDLWQSDFFVSASLREGQSNALLEAMSAGLVPIIANASGAADVVAHGRTGFLVDRSAPDAFVAAMRAALALPAAEREAIALAARQFAADHIGIDAVAQHTVAMFDDIRARRAG